MTPLQYQLNTLMNAIDRIDKDVCRLGDRLVDTTDTQAQQIRELQSKVDYLVSTTPIAGNTEEKIPSASAYESLEYFKGRLYAATRTFESMPSASNYNTLQSIMLKYQEIFLYSHNFER